ncbi:MAG: hypothetical protein ABS81_14980 [Pseudonocardia sp. SCN 72-86]|nr:MAG: hypothetical protein ABS81_14980 [Pseudonocardia sp. SCN 72-86]
MSANLPTMPAFRSENPLTTVVLAAAHESRNMAGPTPDDVLDGWSRLIDANRRAANQAERVFVEQARAAGWPDDRTRNALLLPAGTDLDARAAELNALVRREPPPRSS